MNMDKDKGDRNVSYRGVFGSSLSKEGELQIHLANTVNTDKGFSFIYKKTEKIAAAVYAMSDRLPDSEPIKDNIRKAVLNNIKDVSLIVKKDRSGSPKGVDTLRSNVMQLISFLDIGQFSGLFSEMNCSVLKRELSNLLSSIESYLSPESAAFGEDHFFVGDSLPQSAAVKGQQKEVQNPGNSPSQAPHYAPKNSGSALSSSVTGSESGSSKRPRANGTRVMRKSNEKKEQRRSTLLSLIKKKGHITVSEASEVIEGCSQKTLQRELLALVDQDVLKKEGERRWSRYSFAL